MTIETTAPTAQLSHARQFLLAGFLLLLLMVLLSVWFAHRTREDNAATQTTLLQTQQLASLLSTMRQAETGERAYLLTGDQQYLTTVYQVALTAVPGELRALETSFGNGPEAQDLAAVNQAVAVKLGELSTSIGKFQAGDLPGAIRLMESRVNDHSIARLRDVIGVMQSAQMRNLGQRREMASISGWLLQAAVLATVIATALVAWFAIRENRLQNEQLRAAQASLRDANEALEHKVEERTRTLRASQAALAEANTSLEARVAERSRELDRIFKLSTDLLAVADFSGRFRHVSPAWTQITGWPAETACSRLITDFIHPDDRARSIDAFAKLKEGVPLIGFENRFRRAGGTWCWLAWRAVPIVGDQLIYTIARDVTQDKAREEQLRQSQKMEIVGQLTGGIAHDFNNLLTVIMGSLELLQRDLKVAEPKVARRMEVAMGGAKRAAALTHRLLAFSRRQPLAPQPLDANRLLAGMSDMLHRTLGETTNVELVSAAGLWQAMADPNQLENAVLNLSVNARDAMPAGGHITIETQNAHLDEAYAADKIDVQPGQYVLIAITDTGTGMTDEVKEKVFEPFFTTKPQGQGTGLGLAQVYGFIKQSGGHVSIYSEVGQGTTVKLYLPRLRATAAPLKKPAPEAAPEPARRGDGETILLVEDEAAVRDFSREILEDHGYHVLAAEDAETALAIFEATPRIDLLFTDVVLTGKTNGRQLADRLSARRPDILVLFTTGYTRNAIIHHGRLDEGINFIGKPFTATDLASTVSRLLDGARTAALAGSEIRQA